IVHLPEALAPDQLAGSLGRPFGFCLLAHALVLQRQFPDALHALDRGFERIVATGEAVWESELHRGKGLLLIAQDRPDEGRASLQQALPIARQQRSNSRALRAAMRLASHWGEQGQRTKARDLLAPVYSWFTEGFDTADLRAAKTLPDELS